MSIEYCAEDQLLELLAADDLILFAVTDLGAVVSFLEPSEASTTAEEVQS